jgi:hypothetical protein
MEKVRGEAAILVGDSITTQIRDLSTRMGHPMEYETPSMIMESFPAPFMQHPFQAGEGTMVSG